MLVCPNCRSTISKINHKEEIEFYFCEDCECIFPIIDDIPIIFNWHSKNYKLEMPFLTKLMIEVGTGHIAKVTRVIIDKNIAELEMLRDSEIWEWEDETFWSEAYAEEMNSSTPKDWSLTEKLRAPVKSFFSSNKIESGAILDVGCGEGQNFRNYIHEYINSDVEYIAVDVSFNALKLNRLRNKHQNCHYILASADNLPFRDRSIDVMCFFGILHHTQGKALALQRSLDILKPNGLFVIHEALVKPNPSDFLPFLRKKSGEESAHEERIDRTSLFAVLESQSVKCIIRVDFFTLIFGAFRRLMQQKGFVQTALFASVLAIDRVVASTLGRVLKIFASGDILFIGRIKK